MPKNLGTWDRWMRLIVGLFVFSLLFWGPHTAWGWLGLVLILTAAIGHCPLYTMLGVKTCEGHPSS